MLQQRPPRPEQHPMKPRCLCLAAPKNRSPKFGIFSFQEPPPRTSILLLIYFQPTLLPTRRWGRSPGFTSAVHLATWKAGSRSIPTTVRATGTHRGSMAPRPPRVRVRQQSPAPRQRRAPTHTHTHTENLRISKRFPSLTQEVSTLSECGKHSDFCFSLKEGK